MVLVSGIVAAVADRKFGKRPEELPQLEAEFSPSEYDKMANEKNLALEAEVFKFEQSNMGANFPWAASAPLKFRYDKQSVVFSTTFRPLTGRLDSIAFRVDAIENMFLRTGGQQSCLDPRIAHEDATEMLMAVQRGHELERSVRKWSLYLTERSMHQSNKFTSALSDNSADIAAARAAHVALLEQRAAMLKRLVDQTIALMWSAPSTASAPAADTAQTPAMPKTEHKTTKTPELSTAPKDEVVEEKEEEEEDALRRRVSNGELSIQYLVNQSQKLSAEAEKIKYCTDTEMVDFLNKESGMTMTITQAGKLGSPGGMPIGEIKDRLELAQTQRASNLHLQEVNKKKEPHLLSIINGETTLTQTVSMDAARSSKSFAGIKKGMAGLCIDLEDMARQCLNLAKLVANAIKYKANIAAGEPDARSDTWYPENEGKDFEVILKILENKQPQLPLPILQDASPATEELFKKAVSIIKKHRVLASLIFAEPPMDMTKMPSPQQVAKATNLSAPDALPAGQNLHGDMSSCC